MALFTNHPSDPVREGLPEDHPQPRFWVGSFEQVGQLSARTADRDRRVRVAAALRLIDDVAQIGGQLAVAQPRFVGGDLHGDRYEAVVVAFQVRPQQGFEVFGAGHGGVQWWGVLLVGRRDRNVIYTFQIDNYSCHFEGVGDLKGAEW